MGWYTCAVSKKLRLVVCVRNEMMSEIVEEVQQKNSLIEVYERAVEAWESVSDVLYNTIEDITKEKRVMDILQMLSVLKDVARLLEQGALNRLVASYLVWYMMEEAGDVEVIDETELNKYPRSKYAYVWVG